MELGALINALSLYDEDANIEFDFGNIAPTKLDSWRGRYEELALGYDFSPTTVGQVLKDCKEAVGKTFEGYKGGDFVMTETTEVRIDNPGEFTCTQLLGVSSMWGRVVLITAKVDM